MRLRENVSVDVEKTFGKVLFSAMHAEKFEENEDGTLSDKVISRSYDLISFGQDDMIRVRVKGDAPALDFPYRAEVKLVGVTASSIAQRGRNADALWVITAENIVLANPQGQPQGQPKQGQPQPQGQPNEKK